MPAGIEQAVNAGEELGFEELRAEMVGCLRGICVIVRMGMTAGV